MSLHTWDADVEHIGYVKVQKVATVPLTTSAADEGKVIYAEDTNQYFGSDGTAWSVIGGASTVHNNLTSIQGGGSGEYYHLTEDEYNAIENSDSPSAANPFATISDIPVLPSLTLIQGTKDDASTNEGYIDSSDIAEDDIGGAVAGLIFSTDLNSGDGGTTSNWSDILPLARNSTAKRTIIAIRAHRTNDSLTSDEDIFTGKIIVDWENSRVLGYGMAIYGLGYAYLMNFRLTGTIVASTADQTFSMARFNGTYLTGSHAVPRLKISNDGGVQEINELPTLGTFNCVGYEIRDELF